MTEETGVPAGATDPVSAPTAGTLLREARTAAGLSIDAIAQQLKLAPRQVAAIEESDFAGLPGRTFVRGFVRNYARALRLDADLLLAALPDPGAAPGLAEASLAPTPRPMGEIPADIGQRPSAARWAIPLALVAIVTVAAVYEWTRPQADPASARADRTAAATQGTVANAPAVMSPAQSDRPAADGGARSEAAPASVETVPAVPPADAPLAFVFRGTSWVEVKDARGTIVLSTMGLPGARHATGGPLPLEVVIGNAESVTVTWRGAPFDLAPHTRQNVAKFLLK